jgi:hypothetical protein
VSYGRNYYGEDDDVREKTVPKLPPHEWLSTARPGDSVGYGNEIHLVAGGLSWLGGAQRGVGEATIPVDPDVCAVCLMPMRDEKPCHWIGTDPIHKECVGPAIKRDVAK